MWEWEWEWSLGSWGGEVRCMCRVAASVYTKVLCG